MDRAFLPHAEACRAELFALCRALLWEKGDLEDAVQEVLVQALRAWPRFESGTNFKRWFFRVATLTIYNLNRKRRPAPLPAAEPASTDDLAGELQLEESYESVLRDPGRVVATLGQPLRSGVELLNETERAVFLLRALCDLKYQEIAESLEIPIGSVMGNLARARGKLRKCLAEVAREV